AQAARSGLQVPRTLITNDPLTARSWGMFSAEPCLSKSLGRDLASDPMTVLPIVTRIVEPQTFGPEIALTAHLLQAYVDKVFDVRVTVVGRHLFAVAIHAHTDETVLDWRVDYSSLSYELVEVPADVRKSIMALMTQLGL